MKCAKCHPDRTGPFIYQHLSGTSDFGEGCLSCHNPHASANINLLKANGRALCLSCHTDMADHKGAATCWTSGCHSQIHGSNDNMLFIN
jgi:predicted CXXCH cytochrome family protein